MAAWLKVLLGICSATNLKNLKPNSDGLKDINSYSIQGCRCHSSEPDRTVNFATTLGANMGAALAGHGFVAGRKTVGRSTCVSAAVIVPMLILAFS